MVFSVIKFILGCICYHVSSCMLLLILIWVMQDHFLEDDYQSPAFVYTGLLMNVIVPILVLSCFKVWKQRHKPV